MLIYLASNYYVIKNVYKALVRLTPAWLAWTIVLILAILSLCIILSFVARNIESNKNLKMIINTAAAYWMGLFAFLLMSFLAKDLILLLLKLIGMKVRSIRPVMAWVALLIALVISATGFISAGHVYMRDYTLDLVKVDPGHGLRIALISDLHLGAIESEKRLPDIISKVNSTHPDLVVIAGDVFDDDFDKIKDPSAVEKSLRSLNSTYGTYATLGNHDRGQSFPSMLALLENSQVTLLNEEATLIDDKFELIGRLDPRTPNVAGVGSRGHMSDLTYEKDKTIIVVDHDPGHYQEYENIDLLLSGHTHHGQIFPGNLITDLIYRVSYGHKYLEDKGFAHIVSSGTGTWGPPMRVGSRNEVVVVDIK